MDIKMIASDMDGTLLKDDLMSDRTKKTLLDCWEKGLEIVVATGRILPSAIYNYKKIGIDGYVIACNGALIYDTRKESILYKKAIKKEKVLELIELADKYNMYYHFYTEKKFYLITRSRTIGDSFYNYDGDYYKEGIDVIKTDQPLELLDLDSENIYKFIFIDENLESLKRFRQSLEEIDGLFITSSRFNNIEVMTEDVNKARALEYLTRKLAIDLKEVMSFGDNENDLHMLKASGIGVAMKNGEDIVKKEADFIAESNYDDGVALVLEKYILER